jgi:hypothetical protein
MSTLHLLTNAKPVTSRLEWMKQEPDVISVRIENGDMAKAAAALENVAHARGLKIAEVARVTLDGAEAAFARGS